MSFAVDDHWRELRNRASVEAGSLLVESNEVVIMNARPGAIENEGYCLHCLRHFRRRYGCCRLCPYCGTRHCYTIRRFT